MSKQFPKSNEFYDAIINDMYSLLLKVRFQDTKKSKKEYFEINTNISDLGKKINILNIYSLDKNLQKKKNNIIIHLITNYIKYIEVCLNNNYFEEINLISDFCFAYLALVCFRYIFSPNFKKEEFFSFNLKYYNNFSSLIEKYSFTEEIKYVYEKNIIQLKNEENKYMTLIQIFDRNKIFDLLFNEEQKEEEKNNEQIKCKEIIDYNSDENKQNDLNKKGKNINNEIPNINNLNNNNNSIINIYNNKDSNGDNNDIKKIISEQKETLDSNDNDYNISKNIKEKIEDKVTNDGLFSNHIYFNYNDFKPYSADDLRKLFYENPKGCKTIKEFINKYYFNSDGELSTKNAYRLQNGEYLPNRVKNVHDKIINEILNSADTPPKEKKPIVFLYGGGSASGKTTVIISQIKPQIEKTGLKFANIDVDEIGKRLPEFEYFYKQNSMNASSRTHMESVYIRDRAVNELMKRRKCFQLDGIMRSQKRYKNIISQLKKNGYEVNLVGITIPTLEGIKRAKDRVDRNVEEDLLKQGHKAFANTWIELCKESEVDSFSLYDNSQPFGKSPILIMDKNRIYDDNLYQRFLEKTRENL